MRLVAKLPAFLLILLLVSGCSALWPDERATDDRLSVFPTEDLPLRQAVELRWNDHQVPYIEARNDHDLAFTLGLVHAHLRGAQLSLLRHVSSGRLSEIAGPPATEIDHALRILDFGHATGEIEAKLPAETRNWVQAFVDGLNHYQAQRREDPPEYGLAGLESEPWTIRDVLRIGRLAGTDVNWLVYFSLLAERGDPEFQRLWDRALEAGQNGTVSFRKGSQQQALSDFLGGLSRSGSNTVVVAPERSASGGALIASDPHLGLNLPNLWILAGLKAPNYQAVGLMVPGLPFVAVGRNPEMAWGGTHMRAASSDLYDVSDLPAEQIDVSETDISVRFWFDETRQVRRTPHGPIITDADILPNGANETLALRWVGHEPSDELSALLQANRATTPEEFRAALESFALSPQNMLIADRAGNIGHIMATFQPVRKDFPPDDLVLDPSDPDTLWQGFHRTSDLPYILNPDKGYLASANNEPTQSGPPMGYFYSPDERVRRLEQFVAGQRNITLDDLADLQRDTRSLGAQDLAGHLLRSIREAELHDRHSEFLGPLESWDGDYAADARAPVVFETLLYHLWPRIQGAENSDDLAGAVNEWNYILAYLQEDLAALLPEERRQALSESLEAAEEDAEAYPRWGDMHRLKAAHSLANLPVIGSFFEYGDYPVGGSRETIMKTAHDLVNARHAARYGSQARHLSDLSDPDENYFVLFGGNDGWLGSANFMDQVPLWRQGDYIRMPLTRDRIVEDFPRLMQLPAGTG
ncbi:penicillin acylase family protein [Fodinicurvata sediminis]|uniref:penicillin acylase family protein n=1 Tax=Fodinicurvata sediminis TaxID=1121832 RepID=UPI0003F5D31C|nr:penicillin acylase family protein [Fodinicurvata sediminis]